MYSTISVAKVQPPSIRFAHMLHPVNQVKYFLEPIISEACLRRNVPALLSRKLTVECFRRRIFLWTPTLKNNCASLHIRSRGIHDFKCFFRCLEAFHPLTAMRSIAGLHPGLQGGNEVPSKNIAEEEKSQTVAEDEIKHFLLLYDYVEDVMERRVPHRGAHLALAREWQARGRLLLGGALASSSAGGGGGAQGALVLLAGDAQEILEQFVSQDPYVTHGLVTDVRVLPWAVVVGSALNPDANPSPKPSNTAEGKPGASHALNPVMVAAVETLAGAGTQGSGGGGGEPTGGCHLSGMTGFARAEGSCGGWRWSWEARSVNGRQLDVRVRGADAYVAVPHWAARSSSARFHRGTVFLSLSRSRLVDKGPVRKRQLSLDRTAVLQVLSEVEEIQLSLPASQKLTLPLTWDALLSLPGVMTWSEGEGRDDEEEEEKKFEAAILEGLDLTLDRLLQSRRVEGVHLAQILAVQLDEISDLTAEAGSLAAVRSDVLRHKLKQQVQELMDSNDGLDPHRLEQEVALLATKIDVREELDRLKVHVATCKDIMARRGTSSTGMKSVASVGRSLDFVGQELLREANTLCAKANDVALTQVGLKLKGVIEQLKEQTANIE